MSVYSDSSIEAEILSVPFSQHNHVLPEQAHSDQDSDEYITREFIQHHYSDNEGDEYTPAEITKGKQKTPAKTQKKSIGTKAVQSAEIQNNEESDGEYDYQQHRDTNGNDANEAEEEQEIDIDENDESQEQLRQLFDKVDSANSENTKDYDAFSMQLVLRAEKRDVEGSQTQETAVVSQGSRAMRRQYLPPDLDNLKGCAHTAFLERDHPKAITLYKELIRRAPYHVPAYSRLARIYHEKGELHQAAALYAILGFLQPSNIDHWNNCGLISMEIGQLGQALRCFRMAIRRSPNDRGLHFHLGEAYIKLRDPAKAVKAFSQVVTSSDPRYWRDVATKLIENDQVGDAINLLTGVLPTTNLNNISFTHLNIIAELYLANNNAKDVKRLLDKALTGRSHVPVVLLCQHAIAALRLRHPDETIAALSHYSPSDYPAEFMPVCEELIKLGDPAAYGILLQIAQVSKENTNLFPAIARAFVKIGKPEESIYWFEMCKDKGDLTLFVEVLEGLGDIGRAKNVLDSLSDLDHSQQIVIHQPVFANDSNTCKALRLFENRKVSGAKLSLRKEYVEFKIEHSGRNPDPSTGKLLIEKLFSQDTLFRGMKNVRPATLFPAIPRRRPKIATLQDLELIDSSEDEEMEEEPVNSEADNRLLFELSVDDWIDVIYRWCHTLTQIKRDPEAALNIVNKVMSATIFVRRRTHSLEVLRRMKLNLHIILGDVAEAINFAGLVNTTKDCNPDTRWFSLNITLAGMTTLSGGKIGYGMLPIRKLKRVELTNHIHYCYALHYCSVGRFQASLMHVIFLHRKFPHNTLCKLLIGIGYIHRGVQHKFAHRQICVLTGLIYMSQIGEADGWSATSLYNFARALHHVGVRSSALEYYKLVLDHPDDLWRWEAGWNISRIFVESKNLRLAEKYMLRYCNS